MDDLLIFGQCFPFIDFLSGLFLEQAISFSFSFSFQCFHLQFCSGSIKLDSDVSWKFRILKFKIKNTHISKYSSENIQPTNNGNCSTIDMITMLTQTYHVHFFSIIIEIVRQEEEEKKRVLYYE